MHAARHCSSAALLPGGRNIVLGAIKYNIMIFNTN